MRFNIKTAQILIILILFILPVNSQANKQPQCINTSLNKIEELNRALLESVDEDVIDKIIHEKDSLITNLFQCIKKDYDIFISTSAFIKKEQAT